MTHKVYGAPWGRRVWLITSLLGLLLLGMAVMLPVVIARDDAHVGWMLWLMPLVPLLILGGTSLWVIRGYELTGDTLLVRRSFWVNRINLADIESVEVDPRACQGAWKTLGNDGLFAMHGRFRSRRLGKFQAYVTNSENSVILKVAGDTVVVSPENPKSFVHELERRREAANSP